MDRDWMDRDWREVFGMPVTVKKMGERYQVSTPNGVKAKSTNLDKAMAQMRLLNALDHGWKPGKAETMARKRMKMPAKNS